MQPGQRQSVDIYSKLPLWFRVSMVLTVVLLFGSGWLLSEGPLKDASNAVRIVFQICIVVLWLGFWASIHSQTAGSRVYRHILPAWKQVLLGLAMTMMLTFGWMCIVAPEGSMIEATKGQIGVAIVIAITTLGFGLLIWFVVWHWASRRVYAMCNGSVAEAGEPARPRDFSNLSGWRFWLRLAVFIVAVFFVFGLFDGLAPYPLLGVSKGAYLATLYAVLFVFALAKCVAMYRQHQIKFRYRGLKFASVRNDLPLSLILFLILAGLALAFALFVDSSVCGPQCDSVAGYVLFGLTIATVVWWLRYWDRNTTDRLLHRDA